MTHIATDPRATQRQLGTWVDSQVHEEFALAARERGQSKAELLRDIVHDLVCQRAIVGRGMS